MAAALVRAVMLYCWRAYLSSGVFVTFTPVRVSILSAVIRLASLYAAMRSGVLMIAVLCMVL